MIKLINLIKRWFNESEVQTIESYDYLYDSDGRNH